MHSIKKSRQADAHALVLLCTRDCCCKVERSVECCQQWLVLEDAAVKSHQMLVVALWQATVSQMSHCARWLLLMLYSACCTVPAARHLYCSLTLMQIPLSVKSAFDRVFTHTYMQRSI